MTENIVDRILKYFDNRGGVYTTFVDCAEIAALIAEHDVEKRAEIDRLTAELRKANDGFEEHERMYYLELDKTESLATELAEARAIIDKLPNKADGWTLDHSTGRPILMYERCSVIQDEQALALWSVINSTREAAERREEER